MQSFRLKTHFGMFAAICALLLVIGVVGCRGLASGARGARKRSISAETGIIRLIGRPGASAKDAKDVLAEKGMAETEYSKLKGSFGFAGLNEFTPDGFEKTLRYYRTTVAGVKTDLDSLLSDAGISAPKNVWDFDDDIDKLETEMLPNLRSLTVCKCLVESAVEAKISRLNKAGVSVQRVGRRRSAQANRFADDFFNIYRAEIEVQAKLEVLLDILRRINEEGRYLVVEEWSIVTPSEDFKVRRELVMVLRAAAFSPKEIAAETE